MAILDGLVPGSRLYGFVGADEAGTSFVPNTFGTDEAKKPGTGSEADVPGGVSTNIGPILNFLDANVTAVGTSFITHHALFP